MNTQQSTVEERLLEQLASIEHDRWAGWQSYLHKFLTYYEIKNGDKTIACYLLSADAYEHWERQIATPYSELTDEEKESDRIEVRKYLPILLSEIQLAEQKAEKKGWDNAFKHVSNTLAVAYGTVFIKKDTLIYIPSVEEIQQKAREEGIEIGRKQMYKPADFLGNEITPKGL